MAFDLKQFYARLDEYYAAHDNAAVEAFLLNSREKAYQEGLSLPGNDGCPSCIPALEPNMAYVAVCNETACFYRGLSRWEESLEQFSCSQQEMESLYRQNTPEYAVILLNKAGTYRYMGDLDHALEYFSRAADILETAPAVSDEVMAGLYNNLGLAYLDKQQPQQALDSLEKALSIIQNHPENIVETGTTWNNLAIAHNRLGQLEAAKKAAQKAVQILAGLDGGVNPHYPAALNTRGMLLSEEGDNELALADFRSALEKTRIVYGENIEYADGCMNCAMVCRRLGREQEAERWEAESRAVSSRLAGRI